MAGWVKEKATYSIIETGIKHTFEANTDFYYPSIEYPECLGDLKHVYVDGVTLFDLLPNFTRSIVVRDGKRYIRYAYPEEVVTDKTTYEFLWKDKE